jgi:hypothetical protein
VEKGMGREIIKIIMRHLLKYLDEVIWRKDNIKVYYYI